MKRFSLVVIFIFICGNIFSQYTITGKVFDAETKEPIPFATLLLKGTTVGTSTDFDGNFNITTDKESDSLLVAYIGYKRVTMKIKRGVSQNVNIPLFIIKEGLDLAEIVV